MYFVYAAIFPLFIYETEMNTLDEITQIYPGVAVVILDQEKRVLLQKRADVGMWGLPSGHVEPGETVAHAAVRELREEANLAIQIVKLIGIYSDPDFQVFHYPDGRRVHFITACFLAKITGGRLRNNSSESLAYQFFKKDCLPDNLLKMGPLWLEDALANQEGRLSAR